MIHMHEIYNHAGINRVFSLSRITTVDTPSIYVIWSTGQLYNIYYAPICFLKRKSSCPIHTTIIILNYQNHPVIICKKVYHRDQDRRVRLSFNIQM